MAAVSLLPSVINGSIHGPDERRDLPRPYKCPLCDKAFHRLEHQTRHIRTHTGEKPHACQFAGCTKRFSRSDELTRHSRIHNNPNSRRSSKAQSTSSYSGHLQASNTSAVTTMMPPPNKAFSKPSSTSVVASPIISPSPSSSPSYSSYRLSISSTNRHPTIHSGGASGILVKSLNNELNHLSSSSVIPGEHNCSLTLPSSPPPPPSSSQKSLTLSSSQAKSSLKTSSNAGLTTSQSGRSQLPSLCYLKSSRSHALEEDDHYLRRPVKRSRPNSPNSPNTTAPPSPTFSHDSLSPTPDHTPLVTPAQSPRLRPFVAISGLNGYDLPSLRNLSLHPHTTPALMPMEPQYLDGPYYHASSKCHSYPLAPVFPRIPSSSSLTEIMLRSDSSLRKLPTPQDARVSIQDLVCSTDT